MKQYGCCVDLCSVVPNDLVVVTQLIKSMKLLRVQGLLNNINAVGDYLRTDGPFEGNNEYFNHVSELLEIFGLQLYFQTVFMLIACPYLKIMAYGPK
jgi:hypothetical protein